MMRTRLEPRIITIIDIDYLIFLFYLKFNYPITMVLEAI